MIDVVRYGPDTGQFDGLAEIVINRPDKRNALTPAMLDDIAGHGRTLGEDASARAIVVRGEGSVFCAGFDLAMCLDDEAVLPALLRGLSEACRVLRRAPTPVVIAAHGAAIAGGCALLGAGDLVVTNRGATLGYPVVPLGISPAVTAPLLSGRIGLRGARHRLLDPDLFTGDEARRIGLADLSVDLAEDVVPRAQIEAMKLASKRPGAYAATKRWLNETISSRTAALAPSSRSASR